MAAAGTTGEGRGLLAGGPSAARRGPGRPGAARGRWRPGGRSEGSRGAVADAAVAGGWRLAAGGPSPAGRGAGKRFSRKFPAGRLAAEIPRQVTD